MSTVIVGAGPVGLYTAICLRQEGHDVHIVDKYAGNFTRPGVVAIEAGDMIIRQLKDRGIDIDIPKAKSTPETYYISDIQKALHQVAEKWGVKFTSAHFEKIEEGTIKVAGSKKGIQCDLLIDCSGESREVIRYVNASNPQCPFNISKIAENPIKNNFIAFITMNKEDAELLSSYKGTTSSVNEVLRFEELRAQGWSQNDMPHWDMRRWELPKEKVRFCCYFEMPEEVMRASPSIKEEWLSTLIHLKSGKRIEFDREPGSLKFRDFEVNPHKVDNPILAADLYPFPIAACGDALMSAEYRKGTGISNGIVTANGLINAINSFPPYTIHPDAFKHHVTEYRNTEGCIQSHIKEVKDLYQSRLNKLTDFKIQNAKLDRYLEAHATLPEDETIKKGLLNQIGELKKLADSELMQRGYEKAEHIYNAVVKACNILETNLSADPTELIKFYNVKARVYSNLERVYKNQSNSEKAIDALDNSSTACSKALSLLDEPTSSQQIIKEGLIKLQEGLEGRKSPYTQEKTTSVEMKK